MVLGGYSKAILYQLKDSIRNLALVSGDENFTLQNV